MDQAEVDRHDVQALLAAFTRPVGVNELAAVLPPIVLERVRERGLTTMEGEMEYLSGVRVIAGE